MKTIPLTYYKNEKKTMYVYPGKLVFEHANILIKTFFITAAVFDVKSFKWTPLPDSTMGQKVARLFDAEKSYECLFTKNAFAAFQKEFADYKV